MLSWLEMFSSKKEGRSAQTHQKIPLFGDIIYVSPENQYIVDNKLYVSVSINEKSTSKKVFDEAIIPALNKELLLAGISNNQSNYQDNNYTGTNYRISVQEQKDYGYEVGKIVDKLVEKIKRIANELNDPESKNQAAVQEVIIDTFNKEHTSEINSAFTDKVASICNVTAKPIIDRFTRVTNNDASLWLANREFESRVLMESDLKIAIWQDLTAVSPRRPYFNTAACIDKMVDEAFDITGTNVSEAVRNTTKLTVKAAFFESLGNSHSKTLASKAFTGLA